MDIVESCKEYIKPFFEGENSGHDLMHTLRVYKLGKELASKEGANTTVVELACLLHDVDDYKLFPETSKNKDHARAFLDKEGIDSATIEWIIKMIDEVSFKGDDSKIPDTIEGMCVQDADRLDAIGAIGIARTFAYGAVHGSKMYDPAILPLVHMDSETYYNHENTTINHFYEKLFLLKDLMNTNSAKAIAKQRDDLMHLFVEAFLDEWNVD